MWSSGTSWIFLGSPSSSPIHISLHIWLIFMLPKLWDQLCYHLKAHLEMRGEARPQHSDVSLALSNTSATFSNSQPPPTDQRQLGYSGPSTAMSHKSRVTCHNSGAQFQLLIYPSIPRPSTQNECAIHRHVLTAQRKGFMSPESPFTKAHKAAEPPMNTRCEASQRTMQVHPTTSRHPTGL